MFDLWVELHPRPGLVQWGLSLDRRPVWMSRGQGLGWLGDAMLCKNILSITLNYARFIPDWLIAPACIEAWRLIDQIPRRLQWAVGWSVWSSSSPCSQFSSSAVLSRSVSAKNSNNVSPPLLLYHRFAPKHTPQCVKYIFLLLYTYLFYCEMCFFLAFSTFKKKFKCQAASWEHLKMKSHLIPIHISIVFHNSHCCFASLS